MEAGGITSVGGWKQIIHKCPVRCIWEGKREWGQQEDKDGKKKIYIEKSRWSVTTLRKHRGAPEAPRAGIYEFTFHTTIIKTEYIFPKTQVHLPV